MLKILKGESYLDFCSRILLNYKDYGFETDRQALIELVGTDMGENTRKLRYGLRNIKEAEEDGISGKFEAENKYKTFKDSVVLVIPDLHAPFIKSGYLEFCKRIYNKYNCNKVVFLGDVLDNHYSSYHESDPDGHSAGMELELAKKQIKDFYVAFPNSMCCIGNHDSISNRKAFTSGLSKEWIKPISEVVDTPNWKYADSFIVDGVKYTHGTGRKARARVKQDFISVVQGHFHSESYIENYVGEDGKRLFSMQLGCGISDSAYAFAYGKHFARPHINVGIVINGELPIIEYMEV